MTSFGNDRPIGVFDSGIGGLSILAALRKAMPSEHFVYFSDASNAPYGERGDEFVMARSRAIGEVLVKHYGVKALVVACNTATAASIHQLRQDYSDLPLIGVEPGIKRAAALTRTGHVGVFATRTTLTSAKFQTLYRQVAAQAQFYLVACDGLASAIERDDASEVDALAVRYLHALGHPLGGGAGQIDYLVLGCTHYSFAMETLRRYTSEEVCLFETGVPVAEHTRNLLTQRDQLRQGEGTLTLESSGALDALRAAAVRLLGLHTV
jgi:glutamate racemase